MNRYITGPVDVFPLLRKRFPTAKRVSGGEFAHVPCPSCLPKNRDKNKRYVTLSSGWSNCFICSKSLSLSQLLNTKIDWSALKDLPAEPVPEKRFNPWSVLIPCRGDATPINKLPEDHPAIKFLRKDGLHDIDHYANNLKFVYVPSDRGVVFMQEPFTTSGDRLIFPVFKDGKLVGWQARALPGTPLGDAKDCLRYLHLFPKGENLFNYDEAKKYKMVVVTEGVKKALKIPNGVATFGKHITDTQLRMLQEWKDIVFMLDGEDDTQELANSLVRRFNAGSFRAVNIDPRKYGFQSPDDASSEDVCRAVYTSWKQHFPGPD